MDGAQWNIDELQEYVVNLRPQKVLGSGGAGVMPAAASLEAQMIVQLQQATAKFAQTYRNGSQDELQATKRDALGKIMVALAVDAISQDQADDLVEAVQALMKEKS